MTYFSFTLLITIFCGSLYILEKRPFKLKIIELMDQKTYPFVLLISTGLIFILTIVGAVGPFLSLISGAATIFIASYLVFRYRQGIDRRMKQ